MKVLSIDGGGVRGLISALILHEIEVRTGRRIADLFDLVVGTSSGGMTALVTAAPHPSGGTRPVHDVVEIYSERAERIFHRSVGHQLRAGGGALHEKYAATGLEQELEEMFGETMLSEATVDVIVTAYDIERRQPVFFRSLDAQERPKEDVAMRLVARASSAAPTYFEPAKLSWADGDYMPLVDGGVFANNPAMCAYADAYGRCEPGELFLVSVGTGALTRPLNYDEVRQWGLAHWARPILDMALDGVNQTIDWQLERLLPPGSYHRFQPRLDDGHSHLDDSRPENMRTLRLTADRLIRNRSEEIDTVCERISAGP